MFWVRNKPLSSCSKQGQLSLPKLYSTEASEWEVKETEDNQSMIGEFQRQGNRKKREKFEERFLIVERNQKSRALM